MTTEGNARAPYEGDGPGEKFHKRPFRQNSSGVSELSTHQAGNYATIGISELEQILKQKSFARSEIQRLIAVLNSRITEDSPSDIVIAERDGAMLSLHTSPSFVTRLEASSTSGSMKRHKHGDESPKSHASIVGSRVVEDKIASPAELANAYKCSTGHALGQDIKLINNNATCLLKTSVASPQHPTTMENLPDELLSNIFIRLLSKQLAQMRTVSKSWNVLLSQSAFIRSHLNRSIHNKDQILLVFYDYEDYFDDFKPFAAFPRRFPHLEVTNRIKLPVNPRRPESSIYIEVIGFINGLICSSYCDDIIQIWNPSLSAVITLPPYSMPSGDYHSVRTYFRFGFDPKTNDYKVPKLTGLVRQPTSDIKWWLQIEIYSMRKGTWEFITERFPSHIKSIFDGNYVCVDSLDGHIFFHCCIDEEMKLHTVVSFDLGSETFREIPLPNFILDHSVAYGLGVLSGKLCLRSQVGDDGVQEVWVMEEYGVHDSWVKRHVFTQFTDGACPYGFTSLGEFLIEDGCGLVVYDPTANKQEVLEDYYQGEYSAIKIVEYVDSLVWVAPALQ